MLHNCHLIFSSQHTWYVNVALLSVHLYTWGKSLCRRTKGHPAAKPNGKRKACWLAWRSKVLLWTWVIPTAAAAPPKQIVRIRIGTTKSERTWYLSGIRSFIAAKPLMKQHQITQTHTHFQKVRNRQRSSTLEVKHSIFTICYSKIHVNTAVTSVAGCAPFRTELRKPLNFPIWISVENGMHGRNSELEFKKVDEQWRRIQMNPCS